MVGTLCRYSKYSEGKWIIDYYNKSVDDKCYVSRIKRVGKG